MININQFEIRTCPSVTFLGLTLPLRCEFVKVKSMYCEDESEDDIEDFDVKLEVKETSSFNDSLNVFSSFFVLFYF